MKKIFSLLILVSLSLPALSVNASAPNSIVLEKIRKYNEFIKANYSSESSTVVTPATTTENTTAIV